MADTLMKLDVPELGVREFNPDTYLTASVLTHVKQWYGELGVYWAFQVALGNGHPDAVACAIWAIRKVEGVQPNPDPGPAGNMEDFSIPRVAFAPNRPDGAKGVRFPLKWDGEEFVLEGDEVFTRKTMKLIGKWYPPLMNVNAFAQSLAMGDPDAARCAVWIALRAAKRDHPKRPDELPDFSVGVVVVKPNQVDTDDEDYVPLPPPPLEVEETSPLDTTRPPDSSSTAIPLGSGPNGSPLSDTSATSDEAS